MVVGDGKGWWSQARKRGAAVGGFSRVTADAPLLLLGAGWDEV